MTRSPPSFDVQELLEKHDGQALDLIAATMPGLRALETEYWPATRDGGFPPVLIGPVDFMSMYQNRQPTDGAATEPAGGG